MSDRGECPECGWKIDHEYSRCLHCGARLDGKKSIFDKKPYKYRAKSKDKGKEENDIQAGCLGCLGILVVAAIIGVFIMFSGDGGSSKSDNNWKNKDNSTMSYIMMKVFVKRRLKSPATAEFPGVLDGRPEHIKQLSNNTYLITSYVDSENSFGAMLRTQFVGKIKQETEDDWKLISLQLIE